MSEVFTASNGKEVDVRMGEVHVDGALWLTRSDARVMREFFLHEAQADWQAKRDAELGRWRSPEHPDYAAYGVEEGQYDGVRVVNERTGYTAFFSRAEVEAWAPGNSTAARAYFDAHPVPAPRPWEDAQSGDVWVLTVDWDSPGPYTKQSPSWFVSPERASRDCSYEGITAGYPIWVDGKPVSAPEDKR